MFRLATAILISAALLGLGFYLTRPAASNEVRARISTADAVNAANSAGFARVTEPRAFVFPQDHGPHPEYQTEWWYYTGNLSSAEGRRFGFQLTFFRRGLTADPVERASHWGAGSIYLAHFAVSDIEADTFYAFDRFSRSAAGLAGASGEPFRVWIEDWYAVGTGADGMTMQLRARQGQAAIDLTLDGTFKPPVLQGERGLSQKSPEPGNASYYYSITRMPARGTISAGGQDYAVEGAAWMDREWSTSALGKGQVGWDWFALQLDDGRDLMFYQVRRADGSADPLSKGTLVAADGGVTRLSSADVQLEALGSWRSPTSGTTYPAGWRIRIPSQQLELEIRPRMANQELPLSVVYWEGAVAVGGTSSGEPIGGSGYLEMTGYGDTSANEDGQQTR